jgi:hypothetical protein
MVSKNILNRRAAILSVWPSFSEAAYELGMRPERLSRIVWGRVRPKQEEARLLAKRVQKTIVFLFPENGDDAAKVE